MNGYDISDVHFFKKLNIDFFFFFFSGVKIEGSVMPPDGPDSWPKYYSKRQWLVFYRINGMAMQGGGLIDGRGEKWWDLPCKPHKVNVIN